ncbi:universal stress protein [Niastella populi]|uniref:UspA domain-containing protein n=1 Tax=Niastella populi TaxID=550983 RepID=A0A1V9FGQ1_9BACT|nr:universal stress protein [Niastella populi]OQP57386.1 hypothetical protein A4R26_24505 [Niastella populi]
MKRILIPTDFSENALKAALYAGVVARKANAALYLVHVIEPVDEKIHQPFPLHEKYLKETLHMRMREVESVKTIILNSHPEITIETAVLSGDISATIAEFSGNNDIDMIIMGTKGATGLKELLIGSVTSKVIGHSKFPVLAIPVDYQPEEPDGILFATNHFEKSNILLTPVIELAKLFFAKIYVIIFVDKEKKGAVEYMSDTRSLYNYLDYLRKTFPGVIFQGELLEGKDFEDAVNAYEEKNKLDIVSMITYPKGFWEKIFKGSETKKMAIHSHIPVLAIPAGNIPGAEESLPML